MEYLVAKAGNSASSSPAFPLPSLSLSSSSSSSSSSASCFRSSLSYPALRPQLRLEKPARRQRCRSFPPYTSSSSSSSLLPLKVSCSGNKPKQHRDSSDEDYLEAHVLEAVSLIPSHGQLFMTLVNGGEVEVDHINPAKGRLLYRSRNPTIFLKIKDEDDDNGDLFLPIIVGEVAVAMLMKGLRGDEKTGRPNQYHLMRDLLASMDYEVLMVRVTERVVDTYHARIYIGKAGEEEMHSVDSRPSDAINLAIRCKVPIYVHKAIVAADAVRPVYATAHSYQSHQKSGRNSILDLPRDGPDPIAEEITLMKNMLLAAVEERYFDAARWRDDLNKFRKSKRQIKQL